MQDTDVRFKSGSGAINCPLGQDTGLRFIGLILGYFLILPLVGVN